MSFICDRCGNPQPVNSTPNKIVTHKRTKAYEPRVDWKGKKDVGGFGWETVREISICYSCKGDV